MEKSILATILVFVGAVLFNLLFWYEKPGVNILLFDIFIIAALFKLNRDSFSERSVQVFVGGTLFLALLVVWHNSLISIFIHFLSFSVMIGLVQARELRFLVFAGLVFASNFFSTPIALVKNLREMPILKGGAYGLGRLKNFWMVILIAPIFFSIYYAANAHFAALADVFFNNLLSWFHFDIDFGRFIFFCIGFGVVGAAIWKNTILSPVLEKFDKEQDLTLLNTAENTASNTSDTYKTALNLLIALNVLAFFNNILDIQHVWLDATERTAAEMKSYVHEGTFILIWGILLALALTLWLFRGDRNFIENAKILRGAAWLWLGQNAVLALSVGVRNARYIDQFGLAYKRIGVFIFLTLALYGLWLMYLKINEKRTFFFFMTRGAWAMYAVLLAACLVNWDVFITRYNLNVQTKSGAVDVRFLVREISDKNLFLLYQNQDKLIAKLPTAPFPEMERQNSAYSEVSPSVGGNDIKKELLQTELDRKKRRFLNEQAEYSWLSWNYSDYVNRQFFKN